MGRRPVKSFATAQAQKRPWLIRTIRALPPVYRIINRVVIDYFASSTVPRPHRFSLWSPSQPWTPASEKFPPTRSEITVGSLRGSDYTSWTGLVDRDFTGRHLPPMTTAAVAALPPETEVLALFKRDAMQPNPRSSALFCFFAQWFTDSFLRTHPTDDRRNTSNHEIDLCQIYGLDEPSTWALREGSNGRLLSRIVNGEEFPAVLYKDGQLNPEFFDTRPAEEGGLSYLRAGRNVAWEQALERSLPGTISDPQRRDHLYAAGLDRGNSTIVYSAFNVIFLREHNRIAAVLQAAHPDWDDNRLFETARLVNIRQLLTIVVDEYIAHIGGLFPFKLDETFAEARRWYRTNRISMEFNLLYRWHSLAPDGLVLDGKQLTGDDYRFNNSLLEKHGVEQVISDASAEPAGRMSLFNTPWFLEKAEERALVWARGHGLQPFNAYRDHFGLTPYASIDDFADGPRTARELGRVYKGRMDDVEFTVGLFAEKRGEDEVMGETLRAMVAYDAFTHILTNPILSKEVHRPETFSKAGWAIVEERAPIAQIVARNTRKPVVVSFDYRQR